MYDFLHNLPDVNLANKERARIECQLIIIKSAQYKLDLHVVFLKVLV